jgi:hypothetical protein
MQEDICICWRPRLFARVTVEDDNERSACKTLPPHTAPWVGSRSRRCASRRRAPTAAPRSRTSSPGRPKGPRPRHCPGPRPATAHRRASRPTAPGGVAEEEKSDACPRSAISSCDLTVECLGMSSTRHHRSTDSSRGYASASTEVPLLYRLYEPILSPHTDHARRGVLPRVDPVEARARPAPHVPRPHQR